MYFSLEIKNAVYREGQWQIAVIDRAEVEWY